MFEITKTDNPPIFKEPNPEEMRKMLLVLNEIRESKSQAQVDEAVNKAIIKICQSIEHYCTSTIIVEKQKEWD